MIPDDGQIQAPPATVTASATGAAVDFSKTVQQDSTSSISSTSLGSLPFRHPSTSVLSRFAATSTPPRSRASSPNGGVPPSRGRPEGPFTSNLRSGTSPFPSDQSTPDDPRHIIFRALVPHIAVYASTDTEAILAQKGFAGGLREMLRPFGETIPGKVTIRDGLGASRSWDDYGVRFVGLGDGWNDDSKVSADILQSRGEQPNGTVEGAGPIWDSRASALRMGGDVNQIEQLVEKHLSHAEMLSGQDYSENRVNGRDEPEICTFMSPFHHLYLRRLLSGIPLLPHETFSHPVACIIAISSDNPAPIESLRQLYEDSSRGDRRLPRWVNGDYLRYYVLVHDEEKGDISKSTALFESMKRHFGLHCHLLRLRSSRCVSSDEDSVRVPKCEWISAAEELAEINAQADDDLEDHAPYLIESDVTAIKTFVREMVTQSVIPFMERCVTTWNDQVASRRRGLSGRFISLSKKWTGFASSTGVSSTAVAGTRSTYDAAHGCYRPDSPEATMRKLGDYAFMLRDGKLAQETYDLLRSDFNHDKAWKYHAGAHEMAALSTLLGGQKMTAKVRSETIEQLLDTASYSYLTRCAAPYYALRCLVFAVELLKHRGGAAADDAARWGTRILEWKLVGRSGAGLISERIAASYAVRQGVGSGAWGSRPRKASLWNVLAADVWLKQDQFAQAEKCLEAARRSTDKKIPSEESLVSRTGMRVYIDELSRELQGKLAAARGTGHPIDSVDGGSMLIEVESERMDTRVHRKSLIGQHTAPFAGLDAVPGGQVRTMQEEKRPVDDDFQ